MKVNHNECFQSSLNQNYFKQYIGPRTEKFQLPPSMNKSFSKDNLGAEFDELPPAYKEVAIEKYREDLEKSLKAVQQSFMDFSFPDVGDDSCFESVQMFERTGLFDFSCSQEVRPWGQSTDFAVGLLVEHYNEASKGACRTVTEFGDEPFSIKTTCAANGATIKRYENDKCEGEPKEDFVPWNYCYDGILKIKYRAKVEELIPIADGDDDVEQPTKGDGSDSSDGGSAGGQNLNEKPPAEEESGGSGGAIAGGVVGAVVVLSVVGAGVYCYKKKQVSINRTLPDIQDHKPLATDVSQSKVQIENPYENDSGANSGSNTTGAVGRTAK